MQDPFAFVLSFLPNFSEVSKILPGDPNSSFRISSLDPREEYWTIKGANVRPLASVSAHPAKPLVIPNPGETSLWISGGRISSQERWTHSRGLAALCYLLELVLILDRGTKSGCALKIEI